jgi:nucleotide-binding universal stress UspA family protein
MTGTPPRGSETESHGTVLVALNGSPSALAAMPVARALADAEHATLHVVHVSDPVEEPRKAMAKLGLGLDDVRRTVVSVASGDPAHAILDLARELHGRAIVLCTHTGGGKSAGALGHVSRDILLTAPYPVVLVPPGRGVEPMRLRTILVPYDGTQSTAAALGPALALARAADSSIVVLHVTDGKSTAAAEREALPSLRYVDQAHHELPSWMREVLGRICRLAHCEDAPRLKLRLAAGKPGGTIAAYAREHDVDLVVVPWHGTLAPTRAATMKAILEAAYCPVMFLRIAPPS